MPAFRPATAVLGVLLLPALVGTGTAHAAPADGLAQLEAFLEGAGSLRAEFRQDVVDGNGDVVETASGRVVLKRPGRFRWDYLVPYQRVVVADGQRLWLYEADLEQVTVRPLTQGLGETPAALLTGERDILERFEHVSSWSGDELSWVRLKPRTADSDFDSVAIGFAGSKPVRFELQDRLGQLTRIHLSKVQVGTVVADAEFRFEPPAGVDVIREGEL